MNQKGVIPLYIIIGILIAVLAGAFIYSKQNSVKKLSTGSQDNQKQATASATSITSPPAASANTPILPTKSSTPKPTSKPTTIPTSSLTPIPTIVPTQPAIVKKNTCEVNVIYGKMGGVDVDPYLVTLVAAYISHDGTYLKGAQWDFEGDGKWDTDLKQLNGNMEHTYNGGGNYNVKLQVQDSNGVMTDVCAKTFNLEGAITASLNGQVFRDLNCNDTKETGDEGIEGVRFSIMSPAGVVYQTAVTNQNGNYSFSKNIKASESLSLQLSPSDHNYIFTDKTVTLNLQNSSATINIPICSR